jgi:hypothetical protein
MSEGLVRGEGFAVDASIIKADAKRAHGGVGADTTEWSNGDGPSRAVREYLAALEESNPTGDDSDDPPGPSTSGKNISLTDPAAQWTAAPGGPAFYAYSTNYLIDLQAGIIVDVEAIDARHKLIHRVVATSGNVHDSKVLPELLHGKETAVWAMRPTRAKAR